MAATTETALPTVKVIAQQPIQHDGKFYAVGKPFDCTDEQAVALGDAVTIIPAEPVVDSGGEDTALGKTKEPAK